MEIDPQMIYGKSWDAQKLLSCWNTLKDLSSEAFTAAMLSTNPAAHTEEDEGGCSPVLPQRMDSWSSFMKVNFQVFQVFAWALGFMVSGAEDRRENVTKNSSFYSCHCA